MSAATDRNAARLDALPPRGRMGTRRPDPAPPGAGRVICERRPWRRGGKPVEHFRLRCQYDARSKPPPQAGHRESEQLTDRAQRQLCDAVEWAHATRSYLTTFLTLTFDAESRDRLDNGETTIQAELGRWFDAVNKARARGFNAVERFRSADGAMASTWPRQRTRFEAIGSPLRYVWVAEAPISDDGTTNPHVHLLIAWRVTPDRFASWAGHLEQLWGRGFAHLEKIKQPSAAAGYLLKACGYLTKGKDRGQGIIRGNRYGIAQCARPPQWEHEWTRELGLMPRMMRHAARWQRATAAPKRRARAALVSERKGTPHSATQHRARLSRRIETLRRELQGRPVIAGRYTVRTTSRGALRAFLAWAEGREGPGQGTDLLPRRRPAKPYTGGPRPLALGATVTREHYAAHIDARRARHAAPDGSSWADWLHLADRYVMPGDDDETPVAAPRPRIDYMPSTRRLYTFDGGRVAAAVTLKHPGPWAPNAPLPPGGI